MFFFENPSEAAVLCKKRTKLRTAFNSGPLEKILDPPLIRVVSVLYREPLFFLLIKDLYVVSLVIFLC